MQQARKLILLLLFAFVCKGISAQQSPEWDAARIRLQLEKLNTLGSVLYFAAHPDDENTRLLAYLATEKKYRTAYLSLTRGDGGQNLIGNEQGEEMGLLRTQELLAARRTDGAEQFFSRANDFGFSKSAREALSIWGHDRILADAVWVIRKFRPDVIICRFPEDSRAGHGHHWASAILAHEAFEAAADPTRFPEQLKYVKPWQAKRILWNTFNFGGNNTTSSDQFSMKVGGFNPLLGKSYGEIAAQSRSMHKSQGFGSSPSRGEQREYFITIAGDAPRQDLMDGINTTWERLPGGSTVAALLKTVLHDFDADAPYKSVPQLVKVYQAIEQLPDGYWKEEKLKELKPLLLNCAGLWMEAYSASPYVTPGQSMQLRASILLQYDQPVTLTGIDFNGSPDKEQQQLEKGEVNNFEKTVQLSDSTAISQPYWLEEKHPQGYYIIRDQRLVGRPENPPAAQVTFHFTLAGLPLQITRAVAYRYTDPVQGEIYKPLVIGPPVTADVESPVYVFTGPQPQKISVKLKTFEASLAGTVELKVPSDFKVQNNDQPFRMSKAGEEQTLQFVLQPAAEVGQNRSETLSVVVKANGKEYTRGIHQITYEHVPAITLFPPAEAKLVSIPLKTEGKNIGYIMGAGDKVPEALRQIGYNVTLLSDAQLSDADLSGFDAIVTGVRAYNTRERLRYVQERLLDYVKNGGTMVVQYNVNGNTVADQLGPYPFRLSRLRVTDENAAVKFLAPDDPVLNVPNKISQADFKDWIQERGLYFVTDVDPHYRKIFSMHDEGESPLDGSLIVCDYGKGKYVYTSLDFFRELPAGVPGAFRLFANLIAGKP